MRMLLARRTVRLRRKLGDPPVIMTTPTVGYRIADPKEPSRW
jgi:hypothetical protein